MHNKLTMLALAAALTPGTTACRQPDGSLQVAS